MSSFDDSFPKTYEAKEIDPKWIEFWEKSQLFKADPSSSKPAFSIVIPPPNVTGVLHMGHALVNILQDILIRWKRMSGFEVLWIPGTDHAGIATQTVVERHLLKTERKKRSDYPREEFLDIVWQWKESHEGKILHQLKKLGSSCDFSRLRFTMDEGCNLAVKKAFKKLYDDGLIYRGDYLVNWDPITQTALADDEVEYEEKQSSLWTIKYPLKEKNAGFVYIATTRPETLLGDVAIAVSPNDPRYKHLIGKIALVPFVEREIPIIADPFVDPSFGTGMVKITPAHDPNDYQMALRHNLPFINILTPAAFINENGGPFKGLPREKAREEIILKLKELKLLEKVDPHLLRVGVSYRSKAIIEPYLSKQWFVKMTPFVERLKQIVKDKKVTILPQSWEHTYFHWLDNLRDWCISRQLWWGHRIPVWYHRDHPDQMICHDGLEDPQEVIDHPDQWIQDPDVLDTWFSSALWPMSTLGWPENTPEFEKFFPTSVLVTGHDILFFWVARMIFMSDYFLKEVPFHETFLHGLIYGKSYWHQLSDGQISYITGEEKKAYDLGKPLPASVQSKWEKLSKSKGNVIDPIEMIHDYGTDAVRMSLAASANQTPQIDLDRRRFEEFKNFTNKIWNGSRFIFMNIEDLTKEDLEKGIELKLFNLEDEWLIAKLNQVIFQVNEALKRYQFDQAALLSYNFFWNEFCSTYLEAVKPVLYRKHGTNELRTNKQRILVYALLSLIRLMHPIAPFITEELFSKLKERFQLARVTCKESLIYSTLIALQAKCCAVSSFPSPQSIALRADVEEEFSLIEKVVYQLRTIRGEMQIPPSMEIDIYFENAPKTLLTNLPLIQSFVKCKKILDQSPPPLSFSASAAVGTLQITVPLPQELASKEKTRLEKEKEKLIALKLRLETQLSNDEFLQKAKSELIEKQKALYSQTESELKVIESRLNRL